MTVLDIVKEKIQNTPGCEGLCNDECGCGMYDLATCHEGPFPDCKLAAAVVMTIDGEGLLVYVPITEVPE